MSMRGRPDAAKPSPFREDMVEPLSGSAQHLGLINMHVALWADRVRSFLSADLQGKTVLVLGAGVCKRVVKLLEGATVILLPIDGEDLHSADTIGLSGQHTVLQQVIHVLGVQESSVDYVVVPFTSPHFPLFGFLLPELHRVLAPSGMLLLCAANPQYAGVSLPVRVQQTPWKAFTKQLMRSPGLGGSAYTLLVSCFDTFSGSEHKTQIGITLPTVPDVQDALRGHGFANVCVGGGFDEAMRVLPFTAKASPQYFLTATKHDGAAQQQAARWATVRVHDGMEEELAKWVAQHVVRWTGMGGGGVFNILEVGCGHLGMAVSLKGMGVAARVFGVDMCPDEVAAARTSGFHGVMTWDVLDPLPLYDDMSFDVIIVTDAVYQHCDVRRVPLFEELGRLLRVGGDLVSVVESERCDASFERAAAEAGALQVTFDRGAACVYVHGVRVQ